MDFVVKYIKCSFCENSYLLKEESCCRKSSIIDVRQGSE